MTIKSRYADPAIGQAFENIAGLFAPMSGQDVAAYATADANRQTAMQRAQQIGLTDMFVNTGDERAAIGGGLYTPNQSFEAVRMGDQTNRRGQDLSYGASVGNNVRDNQRAMDLGIMGDETARRGQDIGLEGTQYVADRNFDGVRYKTDGDNRTALQTNMTDNLMSPLNPGQQTRGLDQETLAALGFDTMPEVAEYSNDRMTSADTKLTNYRAPDGSQGTALQTPQGLVDAQTGAPLPQGTTMFSTAAQGSAEDVGLGRTPAGRVQTQMLEIGTAVGTARSLREMIAANGASQGVIGALRGTGQNLMQTGNELGQFLGGGVAEVMKDVDQGLLDAGVAQEFFDPTLPAIDMLGNMLAFQYAKAMTGERLSNEMLRNARTSLGLDKMLGNQADSLARLDVAIQQLEQQQRFLGNALQSGDTGGQMGGVSVSNPGQISDPGTIVPPAPGQTQRLRFNPATGAFE